MNGKKTMINGAPFVLGILILVSLLANACGGRSETPPTLSPEIIQTRAVATFALGLTQTAFALPTATPSLTSTSTETLAPTNTFTQTATVTQQLPSDSCYSLLFVRDVNIPDNTKMTPGQLFTKTWRVSNNGSCTWESGFKVIFTSGDAMGGTPFTLTDDIDPGQALEISVDLTAPSTAGSYQGNWRMTNETGVFFGDNFYVLITVVDQTPTPSATQTTAPTITETPTETPIP